MKKTTTEILKDMLLTGKHINKFDFLNATNSTCLAQRVLDLKEEGWKIHSNVIKGKGTLTEYWLDHNEITRIVKPQQESLFTGLWG